MGEKRDSASCALTGLQDELVRAVHSTGTPVVVVLINGRPLAVPWIAENIPAVIEAWMPGEFGGTAIAEILFGDCNPSGKLPITFPRHAGQIPVFYDYKPSKRMRMFGTGYVDMPSFPLWQFGHGLSYTQFEYSGLRITPKVVPAGGNVSVSLTIKNTGNREGIETAQLYLSDDIASVTVPVRSLRGFQRVRLKKGESRRIRFGLTEKDMSLLDADLKRVCEPGTFTVMVGSSCEDIRLKGKFECQSPRIFTPFIKVW